MFTLGTPLGVVQGANLSGLELHGHLAQLCVAMTKFKTLFIP